MELFVTVGSHIITALLSVSAVLSGLLVAPAAPQALPADELAQLPNSAPANTVIPRILLENTAYQQAAVHTSRGVITDHAAEDPVEALVNIYCTYRTDKTIKYTTGTGFFISPAGVILANAHVAQFLLLETVTNTGTTACTIRNGDPATPAYEAELLYISPTWIQENAHQIANPAPRGTGAYDFALLYITRGVNNNPLPATVPFVDVDTSLRNINTVGRPVTIGGYPTLDPIILPTDGDLSRVQASTTLADLYTFGTSYGDVYSLTGTNIGQRGISGGPVIDTNGQAVAMIVTQGDATAFGTGSLNAITLSYIDRMITQETGFSLSETISGNIAYKSHIFTSTLVPFLARFLEREL